MAAQVCDYTENHQFIFQLQKLVLKYLENKTSRIAKKLLGKNKNEEHCINTSIYLNVYKDRVICGTGSKIKTVMEKSKAQKQIPVSNAYRFH